MEIHYFASSISYCLRKKCEFFHDVCIRTGSFARGHISIYRMFGKCPINLFKSPHVTVVNCTRSNDDLAHFIRTQHVYYIAVRKLTDYFIRIFTRMKWIYCDSAVIPVQLSEQIFTISMHIFISLSKNLL